jgi:hypothetical protein
LRVEWFAPQTKHAHTATPFFASRYREIGKNRVQIKHSHMIRSNIQNRYGIQHKTRSWISHRVFHFPIAYGKESGHAMSYRQFRFYPNPHLYLQSNVFIYVIGASTLFIWPQKDSWLFLSLPLARDQPIRNINFGWRHASHGKPHM